MNPRAKCPSLTTTTNPNAGIIDFELSRDDEAAIAAAQAITPDRDMTYGQWMGVAVDDDDLVPQCEQPVSVTSRDVRTLAVLVAQAQRDLKSLTQRLEEICGACDAMEDVRQRAKQRQRATRTLARLETRALRARWQK